MNIEVVKKFSFDAAHFLPNYKGKCKNIHGHCWELHIGFKGPVNPETGMVIDFVEIKQIINQLIINQLDHQFLNQLLTKWEFPCYCPTAENMVAWIIKVLKKEIPPFIMLLLNSVRLYETSTSYVEWRRGENVED